jgi:hypothetical protein
MKTFPVALTLDERAAIAALINNEMADGSSKFGAHGHAMIKLDTLLILALRYAGRRLANWAARHVERMCAEALARPIHPRDWDAEMMELVAAEQKRDN